MTELLVGTKKGLFALQGDNGTFEITARAFAGEPCEFATRDERSGRYLACVTSAFYLGPKIFVTDDPAGEWQQAEGLALPEGGETSLERLWSIVPGEEDGLLYAGGAPGVLFESRDGGMNWELNQPCLVPADKTRVETLAQAGGVHATRSRPGPATPRGSPSRSRRSASGSPMTAASRGGTATRGSNARYMPEDVPEDALPRSASTTCTATPTKPERPVHAVPRRRVPLGRRRRELDRHR